MHMSHGRKNRRRNGIRTWIYLCMNGSDRMGWDGMEWSRIGTERIVLDWIGWDGMDWMAWVLIGLLVMFLWFCGLGPHDSCHDDDVCVCVWVCAMWPPMQMLMTFVPPRTHTHIRTQILWLSVQKDILIRTQAIGNLWCPPQKNISASFFKPQKPDSH